MLSIIKYQLRNRRNAFLLKGGILLGLHLVVWTLEAREILAGTYSLTPSAGFWLFVTGVYTVLLTIATFLTCASGHASDLLYKDTGYLMLAVPRRGWQILGGRFVAGFVEFFAYALLALACVFIHAAMVITLKSAGTAGFGESLRFVASRVFGANLAALGKFLLILLSAYASLGMSLTFAFVLSRSFVRNRALSIAGAAAVFVVLVNATTFLGSALALRLDWSLTFPFSVWAGPPGGSPFAQPEALPIIQTLVVPVAPFLLYPVLALALLSAASWLMEKKVEL